MQSDPYNIRILVMKHLPKLIEWHGVILDRGTLVFIVCHVIGATVRCANSSPPDSYAHWHTTL